MLEPPRSSEDQRTCAIPEIERNAQANISKIDLLISLTTDETVWLRMAGRSASRDLFLMASVLR
jgi:hypothetical protein